MEFGERLKKKRRELGLSQAALAEMAGVTCRTVQNYELGTRTPHNVGIVASLATALKTTAEALLGSGDALVIDAYEKGGAAAARDVGALVNEVTGLFAGGELPEEDMDAVMEALNAAYWDAKKKNRKYAKKNRN